MICKSNKSMHTSICQVICSDDGQIRPKHVTTVSSNWHKMKINMRMWTYVYVLVKLCEDEKISHINSTQNNAKILFSPHWMWNKNMY